MSRFSKLVIAVAVLLTACSPADAQWLKLKTANVPRTADGKPDTNAAAPRLAEKPDLSGVWRYEPDPYTSNITVDLQPSEIDPTVQELYKQRMEHLG